MTNEQTIIRNKLGLLEPAAYLKNMSETCRVMGYSRDTFYRARNVYGARCLELLTEKSLNRAPDIKTAVHERRHRYP